MKYNVIKCNKDKRYASIKNKNSDINKNKKNKQWIELKKSINAQTKPILKDLFSLK